MFSPRSALSFQFAPLAWINKAELEFCKLNLLLSFAYQPSENTQVQLDCRYMSPNTLVFQLLGPTFLDRY